MISVFDMYKIGIGPSSSHTVGPMKAGRQFVLDLLTAGLLARTDHVRADVYGSLSLTGRGHNTDLAILLGLMGYQPDSVDIEYIPQAIEAVKINGHLTLNEADPANSRTIAFDFKVDMPFHREFLKLHENGMTLTACAGEEVLLTKTYYSIGGGFIVDEEHFGVADKSESNEPFPYRNAAELVRHCKDQGLPISGIIRQNELSQRSETELGEHLRRVWQTMSEAIERGQRAEGVLPGPLKVPRRAAKLRRIIESRPAGQTDPLETMDWLNLFALAVNEENAAGGRVVTAPTNGACGIIPAVLAYYDKFIQPLTPETIGRYLLTTSAIGTLYKMNASISGAEVGCQGEVGVACSMAAAGLTEIMGGTPEQVCMAAEIGMEHNLGLTCDPVGGQVQVPCIERNAIGSVKAVNASRMALRRTEEPRVALDTVIETMYETGRDMNAKYRETSTGGLAVKVPCN